NNTVFFSDASTKWVPTEFPNEMWEVNPSGRLIKVDLRTGEASTLAWNLSFANGVQVFPDKQSILVSESTAARIIRVYIAGEKKGQVEVFIDNLPGLLKRTRTTTSLTSIALTSIKYANRLLSRNCPRLRSVV
uniref:Str_synth domain-containing protein n=1 Tax=Steinernema glaseri TaxID=37863 RepID=A0A1I7XZ23_9BILA